jgi:hypothetical protein
MARKILFFTGKGGTGKSMVAAGYAMAQAEKGLRVLLVELGETSFFEGILTKGPVGFEPKEVSPNLFLAHWDGYRCLRDYIHHLVKSEAITNLVYENPFMRTLVDVGPSLAELAIVGKITSGVRHVGPALNYDLIVVDSYATGHMLAMLRAPIGIAEAVKFGPMATQCRDMIGVLRNPQITGYNLVTLPEELSVTESIELYNDILMEVGVKSSFLCNNIMDIPATEEELEKVIVDDEAEPPLKIFSKYLIDKCEMQKEQIHRLEVEAAPIHKVPRFLDSHSSGVIKEISNIVKGWGHD